MLHGEEVAATVFGGDFEGGGSVGDWPLEVIAVFPCPDGRHGGRWSGGAGGSSGRGLEGAGEEARRKCSSEELEKRAAFKYGHRFTPGWNGSEYRPAVTWIKPWLNRWFELTLEWAHSCDKTPHEWGTGTRLYQAKHDFRKTDGTRRVGSA
jgi:hypothetical protein